MTTRKLYYENTYVRQFTANVADISRLPDGKYAVTLDQTAFYPQGGGQPFDLGYLDSKPVLAVCANKTDIIHVMAVAPQTSQVVGEIDWSRRFDHMQQHSAQHLLSAACAAVLGAETIGFHLGATSSQIDLNLANLTTTQTTDVEKLTNAMIFANKPVQARLVTADELAQFPLRKQPSKNFAAIRLVEIDQFDYCPCGGTHVAATGEIGIVKIRFWERKNNAVRLDFVAGYRALSDYAGKNTAVHEIASRLNAPQQDLLTAVDNSFAKLDLLSQQLTLIKRELHHEISQRLLREANTVRDIKLVVHIQENTVPAEINNIANNVVAQAKTIALLAGINPEKTKAHLVFSRAPDLNLDMSKYLQTVLTDLAGKGGGSPQRAQGGTTKLTDLKAALQHAQKVITTALLKS